MVEYMSTWRGTRYWCDGVLTLAVGGVGFVGNIFSILILSSRSVAGKGAAARFSEDSRNLTSRALKRESEMGTKGSRSLLRNVTVGMPQVRAVYE